MLPKKVFRVLQVLAMIAGITGAAIAVLKAVRLDVHLPVLPLGDALWWALLFQTVAIFFMLGFVRPLLPTRNDPEFAVAVDASRQFWRCWIILWASWFGLYLTWFISQSQPASTTVHVIGDLFNMVSSAALFLCYLVMVLKTVPPKQYGFHQVVFWVVSACVAIACFEFVSARNQPAAQQRQIMLAFHWVQGLLSGVALALLVGRLDSKFIDTPRLIVAALYAYAVIQFSYPVIEENEALLLVMTSAALFLKILLFYQVGKLLASGTIFWYMFEYRRLFDAGNTEKEAFLRKLVVPETP